MTSTSRTAYYRYFSFTFFGGKADSVWQQRAGV